jgi:hypothetical protein
VQERCAELVIRLPVLLAVEQRLIKTSLDGLSALLGVSHDTIAELVKANLGLVAVPAEVVASAVQALGEDLGVGVETVLLLLTKQPTLLCTQVGPSIDSMLSCKWPRNAALSRCVQAERTADK